MRALIVAIHLFVLNFVGLGIGPLWIGMMNDAFAAEYGEAGAIRLSLMIVTACTLVAVGFMVWAARLIKAKA